ncbi:MAG TPA: glycine cleavage system aminomethyltransferase GcvT [Nitriliruptorales bacterium]|nr:glycine cleavage system aminomethyltransferase GcvT [Nitriliruptorales bacterium]
MTTAAQHEGLIKGALYSVHEQLGARIAPFAGWAMPIEYAGTLAEHRAVREDVGVFDVSHLGNIWVSGGGAEDTVAATFTNDPGDLEDGTSQYTLCCDEDGGVIDDLIVYRLNGDRFMVVPNAANRSAVLELLQAPAEQHGARVADDSMRLAILAVQGPRSLELVHQLFPDVVGTVPYHGIGYIDLGPSDDGWLCRTGYTGEVGCELMLPGLDAPGYFRELLELGATPVGLGARDTLRLEMGYPLHGNELSRDTDPFEAQLGWAVKLEGRRFRGSAALERRQEQGPQRRLWGIRATDRGIPRAGMTVTSDGDQVGTVTSGSFSPTLRTGIGLAYLAVPVGPGDEVTVDLRGRPALFEVVRPPFVDRDPRDG